MADLLGDRPVSAGFSSECWWTARECTADVDNRLDTGGAET